MNRHPDLSTEYRRLIPQGKVQSKELRDEKVNGTPRHQGQTKMAVRTGTGTRVNTSPRPKCCQMFARVANVISFAQGGSNVVHGTGRECLKRSCHNPFDQLRVKYP